MNRYIHSFVLDDLTKKMVFIGGPRQVGKTTLSKSLSMEFARSIYFNWDASAQRKAIIQQEWRDDAELIILDELHKYRSWKQWIKGVYDTRLESQHFLVTGSARLDVYRRGGDSLMGRYHHWRLHPFTIDELPQDIFPQEGFERLLQLGGFPEPFLSGDERKARRWRRDRFDRVLREDIRDLELVREIQLLGIFVEALQERVGGLVVLANLAQDLQISPVTAKKWLALTERMYMTFAIYPFTKNIPRSILKPPKVYFFDNADVVGSEGARLENLVATTLLKRLHFIEDYYGYRCSLHYIRDKDGREVDFLTVIDNKVHELIEVKTTDDVISPSLEYYAKKLQPRHAVQLVATLRHAYDKHGIQVRSPIEYFSNPPWVSDEIRDISI
jgi:predicted AAA+ superfamily ATPase